MRTLVPKDPHPGVNVYDKESGVGVKGTAARSGAQDDGKKRAEETTATITGTSRYYATPIGMLGQAPSTGEGNRVSGISYDAP
jgi:hypothetical protein